MSDPSEIRVVLNDGRAVTTTIEERVYPDRSCGQYDSGWHVAYGPGEDDGYFVSLDGLVYEIGTDTPIGCAPEVKAAYDEQEAAVERLHRESRPAVTAALDRLLGRSEGSGRPW